MKEKLEALLLEGKARIAEAKNEQALQEVKAFLLGKTKSHHGADEGTAQAGDI